MGEKQQQIPVERRRKQRTVSTAKLRRRVLELVSVAITLGILALISGIVGFVAEVAAWQEASFGLLAVLLVFLCGGFVHVWRLARLYLNELEEALEQLRQAGTAAISANQAKSRFLATVSHELRTPLNGVLGMTSLLLDTPLSDSQKSYADAVDLSARSLLSIIDELLDAARNESDQLIITPAPLQLTDLVESVVELMSPRAHAKNIEVGCFVCPGLFDEVTGDSKRIRQILLNLIGNAIKFTTKGGVTLAVQAGSGTGMIRFEVRDTGHGIPDDEQEEIFERFVQSSLSQAHAGAGTGLGLSISQQLVELMGGEIKVDSSVGEGSRFWFELDLPPVEPETEDQLTTKAQLKNLHVILAAPNGTTRDVVHRYLESYGATVSTTNSVAMVPGLIEQVNPAGKRCKSLVLLLDADLPGSPEATRSVAMKFQETVKVWILLKPEERRLHHAVISDAKLSYLLKPARRATLVQQLGPAQHTLHDSVQGLRDVATLPNRSRQSLGFHVLLVEDNHINTLLATKMLTAVGYTVEHMSTGEEAIAVIGKQISDHGSTRYDVVLMDIHMPGIDGHEATRRIRTMESSFKAARRVPILALSANARSDDHKLSAKAGMDGYLAKPFDRADLEAAISGLVQNTDAA